MDPFTKKLILNRMRNALRRTIETQRSKITPNDLFVVINKEGLLLNDGTGTFSHDIMSATRVPEEFDPE